MKASENWRRREKMRSGVIEGKSKTRGLENKVSIFSCSSSPSSLHLPSIKKKMSPTLVSNLIFITSESLKQFTRSARDMKIDNCDPPGFSAGRTEKTPRGPR